MRVAHFDRAATDEEIRAALERDGCCVIDDLLDSDQVARILTEMQPHMAASECGTDAFDGLLTKRTGSLVARSPASREVIMHPKIIAAADTALAHASNYQLHCTQTIAVGPGSPAQPIHRDQWAFDMFPFPAGFDSTFATMWALTDFTEENGATRIIPGSHRHPDKQEYAVEDTIAAQMSAGSVLLYTGSLYHGAGANVSQRERVGLIVHYSLAWLRQEENQYLCTPQETLDQLPEDLLRLMGYDHAAYSLGFIDGGRDPIAAVRPDLEKPQPALPELG